MARFGIGVTRSGCAFGDRLKYSSRRIFKASDGGNIDLPRPGTGASAVGDRLPRRHGASKLSSDEGPKDFLFLRALREDNEGDNDLSRPRTASCTIDLSRQRTRSLDGGSTGLSCPTVSCNLHGGASDLSRERPRINDVDDDEAFPKRTWRPSTASP